MSPRDAISLKHKRQIWNFLKNARGLPHNLHLLYFLTLNLGVLFCFAIKHSFAINEHLIHGICRKSTSF